MVSPDLVVQAISVMTYINTVAGANLLKKTRNRLSIFYTFKEMYNHVFDNTIVQPRAPLWALSETLFKDELDNYQTKTQQYSLKTAVPTFYKQTDNELEGIVVQLNNGLNFSKLSLSAETLVKPILLYYSATFLASIYSNLYIKWTKAKLNHGLEIKNDKRDVLNSVIAIKPNGFFPRLAASIFLLTGQPNPYTKLITYSARPVAHTGHGECLERFGSLELNEAIMEIQLGDLIGFDYKASEDKMKNDLGFHKFKPNPTVHFLNDILLLFATSHFARYQPLVWKTIIDGKKNSLIVHFNDMIERYQEYCVDLLLHLYEKPFSNFDVGFLGPRTSFYE